MYRTTTFLEPWLNRDFGGNPPMEVQRLFKHRGFKETVFNQVTAGWPAEMREPMEHLHRLRQAETELLFSLVENLFIRHLETKL